MISEMNGCIGSPFDTISYFVYITKDVDHLRQGITIILIPFVGYAGPVLVCLAEDPAHVFSWDRILLL